MTNEERLAANRRGALQRARSREFRQQALRLWAEGRSISRVADFLGISSTYARTLIHRARLENDAHKYEEIDEPPLTTPTRRTP